MYTVSVNDLFDVEKVATRPHMPCRNQESNILLEKQCSCEPIFF